MELRKPVESSDPIKSRKPFHHRFSRWFYHFVLRIFENY